RAARRESAAVTPVQRVEAPVGLVMGFDEQAALERLCPSSVEAKCSADAARRLVVMGRFLVAALLGMTRRERLLERTAAGGGLLQLRQCLPRFGQHRVQLECRGVLSPCKGLLPLALVEVPQEAMRRSERGLFRSHC